MKLLQFSTIHSLYGWVDRLPNTHTHKQVHIWHFGHNKWVFYDLKANTFLCTTFRSTVQSHKNNDKHFVRISYSLHFSHPSSCQFKKKLEHQKCAFDIMEIGKDVKHFQNIFFNSFQVVRFLSWLLRFIETFTRFVSLKHQWKFSGASVSRKKKKPFWLHIFHLQHFHIFTNLFRKWKIKSISKPSNCFQVFRTTIEITKASHFQNIFNWIICLSIREIHLKFKIQSQNFQKMTNTSTIDAKTQQEWDIPTAIWNNLLKMEKRREKKMVDVTIADFIMI